MHTKGKESDEGLVEIIVHEYIQLSIRVYIVWLQCPCIAQHYWSHLLQDHCWEDNMQRVKTAAADEKNIGQKDRAEILALKAHEMM